MTRNIGYLLRIGMLALLALTMPSATTQQPLNVRMLHVAGVYASRPGDPTLYCLAGADYCLPMEDSGEADTFIAAWIAKHPAARAIPVSELIFTPKGSPGALSGVYLWIADGDASLNVSLVRAGFYKAAYMTDRASGLVGDFEDVPQEGPHRLVSDGAYLQLVQELLRAENQAHRELQGIWARPGPPPVAAAPAPQPVSFPARELATLGVRAHRPGDPQTYCLLGAYACLGPVVTRDHALIRHWLDAHPQARAVPLSTGGWRHPPQVPPDAYTTGIWIEDGGDSLELFLIRQGLYAAEALDDRVEDHDFINDGMTFHRDMDQWEFAGRRLVSDADYEARKQRAASAEEEARRAGRGLWSPQGLAGRALPTSDYLIFEYLKHRRWFQRIAALATRYPKLADFDAPGALREARNAGVPEESLEEYTGLLDQLGFGRTRRDDDLGSICIDVASIDHNYPDWLIHHSKGYVFSPRDDAGERLPGTTSIVPIADGWYIYEWRWNDE